MFMFLQLLLVVTWIRTHFYRNEGKEEEGRVGEREEEGCLLVLPPCSSTIVTPL